MEIGLPTLLTIIFLILKLTGAIAWSWWWVFSPLWITAGLVVGFWVIVGLFVLLTGKSIKRGLTRRYRR